MPLSWQHSRIPRSALSLRLLSPFTTYQKVRRNSYTHSQSDQTSLEETRGLAWLNSTQKNTFFFLLGLCVALPIYYASGNRTKGFLWALLSGASEFVAALLGWAILANSFSESAYAILFGMVGGMMVIISTRELLPTAHVYDDGDTVVTYSFIFGMAVMALSLCLFQL